MNAATETYVRPAYLCIPEVLEMERLSETHEAIIAECKRGFDNDVERMEYLTALDQVKADLRRQVEIARVAVRAFNARNA